MTVRNQCWIIYFTILDSFWTFEKIVSIDYTAALALDGVIGSVDANDILGTNEMMQMWQKEHCDRAFATDKVTSTGQIIAGIVGTSKRIAQKAASLGIFS